MFKNIVDLYIHSFHYDGLHVHISTHADEITEMCLSICKEKNYS